MLAIITVIFKFEKINLLINNVCYMLLDFNTIAILLFVI